MVLRSTNVRVVGAGLCACPRTYIQEGNHIGLPQQKAYRYIHVFNVANFSPGHLHRV
jgi:hypothetical protein